MNSGFSKRKLLEFAKRLRERTILIAVIVFCLICIGGGFFLQKGMKSKEKDFEPQEVAKNVEKATSQKQKVTNQQQSKTKEINYSEKPSPDELLQQLTSLGNLNEEAVTSKYIGLRVKWPAYFFTIQPTQGNKATLLLDTTEDGFGVVIESQIDVALFPQIREVEPGKKLYVSGEVLTVDLSGTGTINLRTEVLSIGDEQTSAGKRSAN